MKPLFLHTVNLRYFCLESSLVRGTVLSTDDGIVARKYIKGDLPIGLSLVDVVSIDTLSIRWVNPELQCASGSKIKILEIGTIVYNLNPHLKLPPFQPIYVHPNGKLTWRCLGPRIGETKTKQDKDGYCTISIDFTKGYS